MEKNCGESWKPENGFPMRKIKKNKIRKMHVVEDLCKLRALGGKHGLE